MPVPSNNRINQIRRVIDAGYDYGGPAGTEVINSSNLTGWTTTLWDTSNTNFGSTVANLFYNYRFLDSAGKTPEKDGVTGTSFGVSFNFNVGLRHYHQQMSAMKGWNNNSSPISSTGGIAMDEEYSWNVTHPQLNSPSGQANYWFYGPHPNHPGPGNGTQGNCNNYVGIGSTNSCIENIPYVGEGNGVYQNINISMGRMRGFQYPSNSNSMWPSSTTPSGQSASISPGGEESLAYNGGAAQISVGGSTIY